MLRERLSKARTIGRDAASHDRGTPQAERPPGRLSSLRVRLLALVMLVLVPWLALVLYTQADERNAAIETVNRDAMRLIEIVTSDQAAQIEAARHLLTAFARLPQLRAGRTAACDALLAEMLTAYPLYLNFAVAEPKGDMVCSAVPLQGRVNVADRSYFKRAVDTRRFAIGDYQIGRVTQLPSINYAYPVLDAAGDVEAVVFAAQSLEWLKAVVDRFELPDGAILVVTDRNGTVLARVPDVPGSIGKKLPEQHVLDTVPSGSKGVFESEDAQGVRRLWAQAPIGGLNLSATIGVSKTQAFADIDRRLARNLTGLGLVTVIALGAAWFGAKFILRQVEALVAATRRLASGDLGARARSLGDRSEIGVLARAFNSMATTLQARDNALRAAEERTRAAEVELAVTRAHMDIARQIQQSLLPQGPLTLGGMRFAGRCVPAVAVGGDYFGYFLREGHGIDTFIGDVSGHGVGAALLMAEARTTFMSERLVSSSASAILAKLNALLYDDLDHADLFMTACCATFDATARELRYANAGHPPALLLRAGEPRCTALSADGILLGIAKDAAFAEVKLTLGAGDIVVFYTDGITETSDEAGELFGVERLGDLVVAHRGDDPDALVDAVLAALDRFSGAAEQDDDLTIVAMMQTV